MAIVVRDLTRTFVTGRRRSRRRLEAVRAISFAVEPGERLAYIGPQRRTSDGPIATAGWGILALSAASHA